MCESLLFTGGQGQTSLHELNKGTLVYSQAEGQGPPGKAVIMIIITKATKKQVREQFPTWSQNWLLPCNTGNIPNAEIEAASPALAGRFFTTESPGKL